MIGWIIHWLTACWPIDLLTYRPIGWLSVWLIDWATGWVIAYLTGWLARWLIHWFTALLAYQMIIRLNERLAGWLADRLKDISELKQRRRRRQRGQQKGNGVRFGETTTLHVITLFCTFRCRRCTSTTWNFLISHFMEDGNTWRRFSFSFVKLDIVL